MKRETFFKYVRENYKSEPEYLWKKFPSYGVLRHQNGKKWFAIVMSVSGSKLGLSTGDEIDVLEVKIRPEHI